MRYPVQLRLRRFALVLVGAGVVEIPRPSTKSTRGAIVHDEKCSGHWRQPFQDLPRAWFDCVSLSFRRRLLCMVTPTRQGASLSKYLAPDPEAVHISSFAHQHDTDERGRYTNHLLLLAELT